MNFGKNLFWFTLSNAIVFYLAAMFVSYYVVFGTAHASPLQAVIISALLVSLVVTLVGKWGVDKKFSEGIWMLIYWFINTLTLYLLVRTPLAEYVGMGFRKASITAVVLGFVLNFVQYGVWKSMSRKE